MNWNKILNIAFDIARWVCIITQSILIIATIMNAYVPSRGTIILNQIVVLLILITMSINSYWGNDDWGGFA